LFKLRPSKDSIGHLLFQEVQVKEAESDAGPAVNFFNCPSSKWKESSSTWRIRPFFSTQAAGMSITSELDSEGLGTIAG
jgi:hypothetical protein